MAQFRAEVKGLDEFRARLQKMGTELSDVLEEAIFQGSMVVVKAAQENSQRGGTSFPHRITGKLFRSIAEDSPVVISKTNDRIEMGVGSSMKYARRLELGFVGRDSRGRVYHQSPRAFLRPALDQNTDRVVAEVQKRLHDLFRRYMQ